MQVVQSRCYETATAYWRRIKTDPDAETMGVLYWQLNDIWQACSYPKPISLTHAKHCCCLAESFALSFLCASLSAVPLKYIANLPLTYVAVG